MLLRPSGICVWKRRKPASLWKESDAEFLPGKGWKFKGKQFERWSIEICKVQLNLRLQNNGQVGIFPEHAQYLHELGEILNKLNKSAKVLNLFAYTGLASSYCALRNSHVCHVDISKKSLDWASENLRLNKISPDLVRMICDDALIFLEREAKRGNHYDLVICDPPSFSRISKNKTWKLEEHIVEVVELCFKVLNRDKGAVFFTCHAPEIGPETAANIMSDLCSKNAKVQSGALTLKETETDRLLPSGFFSYCNYGF